MHKRTSRSALSRLRPEFRGLLVVALAAALLCAVLVAMGSDRKPATTLAATDSPSAAVDVGVATTTVDGAAVAGVAAAGDPTATTVAVDPAAATTVAGAAGEQDLQDVDGEEPGTGGDCTMVDRSARLGDSNASVGCIQQALIAKGLLSGTASGTFDSATQEAVRKLQGSDPNMFVDGVVGRETALALGVWPDEAALVVHTPAPAAGTKDPTGHTLSPVASTGANAPALPENSGSGRRLVYSRTGQRVWAVADDGTILRSWLVSGSKYNNEQPGAHKVYSKSPQSTAWNGKAILPMMVRYQKTSIGAIGFHGIPIHRSDGTVYQTDAELGTRLSGGCQRQNNLDAKFVWDWATIGTTVFVV
jgi:hypothetical protein